MKSERRHELQKNKLADLLSEQIESVKPYFKSILGVIIALIALGFFGSMILSQQSERNSLAWSDYYSAFSLRDPEAFSKIATAHEDTAAGAWAEKTAADLELEEGTRLLYSDRGLAQDSFDRAEKGYLSVIKKSSNQALLLSRAHFGLAQVYECQSKIDLASKEYEKIIADAPQSAFGKEAARRLAKIKQLSEEDWFAWFSKQKPTPTRNPFSQMPGLDPKSFPSFDNLPGASDLKLPASAEKTADDKESDPAPAPPREDSQNDSPAPKKSESPSKNPGDSEKK